MLKEILDEVGKNAGITYNYAKEYRVLTGYAVSLYPDREMSMPVLDEKDLIYFIHTNYDLLIKEENCLGIWWHKGMYVLDIIRVIANVYQAGHIAIINNQKAIYDLDKKQEIFI